MWGEDNDLLSKLKVEADYKGKVLCLRDYIDLKHFNTYLFTCYLSPQSG